MSASALRDQGENLHVGHALVQVDDLAPALELAVLRGAGGVVQRARGAAPDKSTDTVRAGVF